MGFKCRSDQTDKLLAYIDEQAADDQTISIAVRRKVGKHNYRQVGEAFSADELAALGTAESILDACLDLKCKGRGAWELLAYKGSDADGKQRTMPVSRFETVADDVGERAGGGASPGDHAIRDLSVQLRQNADMLAKRLDDSLTRSGEQQDRILELVMGFSGEERAAQDESAGTVLNLSIQLVEARMRLQIAELEIERVRADAASSVIGSIVDKMPPEAIQGAVLAVVQVVGQLGQLAVDRLKGPGPQRVELHREPRPKDPELATPPGDTLPSEPPVEQPPPPAS